ncbi:MAG: hypothetical protein NTZ59_11420, partial [Bacteroidetes bacterium]|nr:hypothetical protein [Bacteroidota bacterium]
GTLALTAGTLTVGANTLTISGNSPTRTSGAIDATNASATVAFTNGSAITLSGGIFGGTLNNLTLNGAGGVTLGAATTVTGTLALTAGTLTVGANTLTISGNSPTRSNGVIDATNASATVAFTNGSAITLPGGIFGGTLRNLTLNGAGGVTLGAATTVSGTLTLTTGTLAVGANTLTLSSNTVPARTSGVIDASNASATVAFTNATGYSLPSSLFTGNVNNLTINGGGVTLGSATTVANALTLTAGTLTNTTNNITLLTGAVITRTAGSLSAVPAISSGSYSVTYNGAANITSGAASTPELTPSGGGTVGAVTVNLSDNTRTVNTSTGTAISATGNLTLTSGNLTLGNNFTTTGSLSVAGSNVLTGTGFTLSVGTDWNVASSGGYTGGINAASIVILNGTGTRTFAHTGGATFRNLQINNGGSYTSSNNITISVNTLNLSNGTLDMGTNTLSGTGDITMTGGTLKLAKLSTTLPEITTLNLSGSSTIELSGAGDQTLLGARSYRNLTFSGSGTKTLSSSITGANTVTGTVTVADGVILDLSNRTFGGSGTNLSLNGTATYKTSGSGTKPDAQGTYTLSSGSTVEFTNVSAAFADIRLTPSYGNVIVSGNAQNPSTANGSINLQNGATFTVASTGTFKHANANGLNCATCAINTNITPILSTGSTIDYARNDGTDQVITPRTYSNITISGSAAKTAASVFTINNTFTRSGSATLGTTAPTYSGTTTLAYVDTTASRNYTAGLEWPSASGPTNVTVNLSGTGTKSVTMGGDRTISGALTLTAGKFGIGANTLTLSGTLSGNSATNSLVGSNVSNLTVTSAIGTIFFDQTTKADVTVTNGTNALLDLVNSGSGSITLGNKLNLFNRLSVSAGTLNTGDSLVLRSTSSNTAYVDNVGGTITGQAVVERYYHKTFRGWRMVTAPLTFAGIANGTIDNVFNNWQSNFGLGNNYGTQFTANVAPSGTNGLDAQTNSANLLRYNSSGAGSWTRIENTKTELIAGSTGSADNKGYFLFIRGDRTVNPTTTGTPNAWAQTTLAAKGKLQTGPQVFNYGGSANVSWLVGNPYAAPVNMGLVNFNNCGSVCYVWDPNLTGITTNSPGAYNSFTIGSWDLGPIGGGSMNKYFQSGQAFLVKPTTSGATITFQESYKSTSANNNTNTTGIINATTDVFNCILYAVQPNGDRTNVDGLRARFGNNYSAAVDAQDGTKASGTIESISLFRDNKNLTLESRPYITSTDSLFVRMANMVLGSNYEFRFNPINFDASVSDCKLIDKFLNIETPISLTSNTSIPFSITSATGSNAADRFTVVFNGSSPLPVKDLQVKAAKKDNKVFVEWGVAKEQDMQLYAVEKSTNGTNFKAIVEVTAKNIDGSSYNAIDNAPNAINYYRIKAIGNDGKFIYSNIVKVEMNSKNNSNISVYPNPVVGNTIGL